LKSANPDIAVGIVDVGKHSSSLGKQPNTLVDIELHFAVVAHLQQQGLTIVLILDIDAFHHVEDLQRLFAKRFDYFLAVGWHMNLISNFDTLSIGAEKQEHFETPDEMSIRCLVRTA
jgi:hypothetical protein